VLGDPRYHYGTRLTGPVTTDVKRFVIEMYEQATGKNCYQEHNRMENQSDIRYFCYSLVRKYGNPGKISEEQKANEFRKHYLRDLPPNLKALRAIANGSGIEVDSTDKMPKSIRGFNHIVNGKSNIVIKDGDTVSGMQNTILHEIREIMEGIFPTIIP